MHSPVTGTTTGTEDEIVIVFCSGANEHRTPAASYRMRFCVHSPRAAMGMLRTGRTKILLYFSSVRSSRSPSSVCTPS